MSEEREQLTSIAGNKKKRKFVYLERYEQYTSITESRLDHLESMNLLHWAVKILIIIGIVFSFIY